MDGNDCKDRPTSNARVESGHLHRSKRPPPPTMTEPAPGKDYKSTVQTPQTDFPQRANLPAREPEALARWESSKLTERVEARRAKAKRFILHDGPPYANGHIHLGHTLNKVLKDIIVRYKTMSGFSAAYVPGFDCHGLPIEQKVLEELSKQKDRTTRTPVEIRRLCHDAAKQWIGTQTAEFKRLGIGGEWDRPYLTLDPQFEAAEVRGLGELVRRGFVVKGFKPVHWDPVFETALAEAEIEYNDAHVSPTIYLRFPLLSNHMPAELKALNRPTLVIWTTTPWTLPANLGVSMNGEFNYVGYEVGDETLIVAEGLLESFLKDAQVSGGRVVGVFPGTLFDKLHCVHPVFDEKTSLVMLGDHVTLDAGTGCVHTAPAHGVDDFAIGMKYGLEVFNPVDEKGCFNALYPEMQGVSVVKVDDTVSKWTSKANALLIEKFRKEGSLLHTGKLTHSYPYSWRSHKPVIMRATEQWFMNVDHDDLRERALKAIDHDVKWIPAWGRDRIRNMVAGRPDWCLSRQRSWGVPIPSVRDKKTNTSILTVELCERFAQLVEKEGTDCWFTRPVEDFLPAAAAEPGRYEKESNILDVWFDSGASHLGVLDVRDNLQWPADLYLEGSDQHRGWFQSSLWVAMGVKGAPPYKAVLTHGFTLDEKGRPMSKSLGNVISPLDVIKDMGADVLRLWVASEDYRGDVAVSKSHLDQVANAYRRIRNTIRFLLGNLADFDPAKDMVPFAKMEEDDQWVLGRLDALQEVVRRAYDEYEFHRVYQDVNAFCVTELGATYLDCAKDRLYCSAPGDRVRRASQTAIYELATRLLAMLAPILPFTTDEAWQYLPANTAHGPRPDSVHLADFPAAAREWHNAARDMKWEKLLALRGEVQRAIEPLRQCEPKVIGNSLEARVVLHPCDANTHDFLQNVVELLPRLFIVSQVELAKTNPDDAEDLDMAAAGLKMTVKIEHARGLKCDRCWTWSEAVGADSDHPTLCPRCAGAVRRLNA